MLNRKPSSKHERDPLRTGIFGLVLVICVVLIAFGYSGLPFWPQGKPYDAYFTDAGGITPGNSVYVSGLKVGAVSAVSLAGNSAKVTFSVDRSIVVGDQSLAAIRTDTILGERSIAVSPAGSGKSTTIPLSRTTTPYTLNGVLQDLGRNANDLNRPQFEQALNVFTQALHDATPQVRGAVDGLTSLSRALNRRDEALQGLLAHAKSVTSVLSERAEQVNKLVEDGNQLFAALDARRAALSALISGIDDVAAQISGFVADNRKVSQTSLLGSLHVELAPPTDRPPTGRLVDGSRITEANTDRFPTTEEVFSALGVVVNKGNVGALEEIIDETHQAVAGRQAQFVNLVPRLAELTAGLNRQVHDIIDALDGLNRVSAILARDKDNLGRALDTLPDAVRVLNQNRDHIVDAFAALKRLTMVTSHVLAETKVDFGEDLKDLYSIVKALNDDRKDFVTSLQLLLTFPFPNFGIKQAVRGDYLNVFTTFDLTLRRIGETFFTTAYFDPNMAHMDEILNPPDFLIGELANLSGQAADPFKIPPGTASGQ
nr:MCE family protein [Mycobacterium tuberculosis]